MTKSTKLFEIFEDQKDLKVKNALINALFGYPNGKGTLMYREDDRRKKFEGTQYAGIVDSSLIEACKDMTPEMRLNYYDDSDLKTPEWLTENNWYAPVVTEVAEPTT